MIPNARPGRPPPSFPQLLPDSSGVLGKALPVADPQAALGPPDGALRAGGELGVPAQEAFLAPTPSKAVENHQAKGGGRGFEQGPGAALLSPTTFKMAKPGVRRVHLPSPGPPWHPRQRPPLAPTSQEGPLRPQHPITPASALRRQWANLFCFSAYSIGLSVTKDDSTKPALSICWLLAGKPVHSAFREALLPPPPVVP